VKNLCGFVEKKEKRKERWNENGDI